MNLPIPKLQPFQSNDTDSRLVKIPALAIYVLVLDLFYLLIGPYVYYKKNLSCLEIIFSRFDDMRMAACLSILVVAASVIVFAIKQFAKSRIVFAILLPVVALINLTAPVGAGNDHTVWLGGTWVVGLLTALSVLVIFINAKYRPTMLAITLTLLAFVSWRSMPFLKISGYSDYFLTGSTLTDALSHSSENELWVMLFNVCPFILFFISFFLKNLKQAAVASCILLLPPLVLAGSGIDGYL